MTVLSTGDNVFTTPGSFSVTTPSAGTITIKCWGAGAGSFEDFFLGGGGGYFAQVNSLPVSSGATIFCKLGAGGTLNHDGETTWVNISSNTKPTSITVGAYADGGKTAGGTPTTLGTITHKGGVDGQATEGGGGGAGSQGDGQDSTLVGVNGIGGAGGTPDGGKGGDSGEDGEQPGGGGGAGANGADGKIIITFNEKIILFPTFFNEINSFFAETISTTYSMSPILYVNISDLAITPTQHLTKVFYKISPSEFAEVNIFLNPSVTPGTAILFPDLYTDVDVFGLDAVSTKLFEILFSNSNSFQTPRILPATVIIHPSLLQDADAFLQFLISLGIDPTEFINQTTFFPSTSTFYPPLATPFKFRQLQNRYKLPVLRTYRR